MLPAGTEILQQTTFVVRPMLRADGCFRLLFFTAKVAERKHTECKNNNEESSHSALNKLIIPIMSMN